MNAEFEYTVMQHRAHELRQQAAEHRRAREAARAARPERRHRSIFARMRAA
ncbi:hypothetical protein [Nonomuraea sp. NPDC048826]|uniref:hypothetical protein n=1 Tax=Nonomuraea sp. NPDC048826 TaxID=3364347 RepID=UPI00371F314B